MSNKVIVGIDTSNYTTSVAVIGLDGELIANLKRPLPVKTGECGLRQSDAVFAHVKNTPSIMQEMGEVLKGYIPVAVGVSEKPRNVEGSYMPCFLVGVGLAESISAASDIPIYRFSHQCGHLTAALYSSKSFELFDREFCAFHVSGGTTEMLRVSPVGNGFRAEIVGATADLNAGQAIDRVGVMMGLSFPAGRELEALALQNTKKIPSASPKLRDLKINLSGLQNMAERMYEESGDKAHVAAFVLAYIERGLSLLADKYIELYGDTPIVFAGGVMSNSIIKCSLAKKYDARFAEPALSADNAVGIAYLGLRNYLSER